MMPRLPTNSSSQNSVSTSGAAVPVNDTCQIIHEKMKPKKQLSFKPGRRVQAVPHAEDAQNNWAFPDNMTHLSFIIRVGTYSVV